MTIAVGCGGLYVDGNNHVLSLDGHRIGLGDVRPLFQSRRGSRRVLVELPTMYTGYSEFLNMPLELVADPGPAFAGSGHAVFEESLR